MGLQRVRRIKVESQLGYPVEAEPEAKACLLGFVWKVSSGSSSKGQGKSNSEEPF